MSKLVNKVPKWIRKVVFVIILHSLIPLVGIIIYINLGTKYVLTRQNEIVFEQLSKIVSTRIEEKINDAEKTLVTLEGLGVFDQSNVDYCTMVSQGVKEDLKVFAFIGAADAEGNVYCSSSPMDEPVNITDRIYFQKAKESLAFSAGEYQMSRITHIPSISLGEPLLDKEGNFDGVGIVTLSLDYLQNLVSGIDLPENFNISIVDKEGIVLTRYPYNMDVLGKKDAEDPAIKEILTSTNKEGSFKLKDNPSGKEKIYAFSKIGGEGDLYTYVDVPVKFINDIANQRLWGDTLLTFGAILMVVVVGCVDWLIYIKRTYPEDKKKD